MPPPILQQSVEPAATAQTTWLHREFKSSQLADQLIQANRMKVQRYQLRLLNSTFPTSDENKVIWNHYSCGPSQPNCITLHCRGCISSGKEWGTVSDCCIFGSFTALLAKLWMIPELQQDSLLLIKPYAIPVFATNSDQQVIQTKFI